ncbi:hypothetical protein MMC06_001434 [Schaereria dolodes]|nr:hypothetical protein [Schaereria dolodes]
MGRAVPWRSTALSANNTRRIYLLSVISILLLWLLFSGKTGYNRSAKWHSTTPWAFHGSRHPIEALMADAKARHIALLRSQSQTLDQATTEYRRRYERAPPKGFDLWFNIAKSLDVVIIDDYDTITNSFEPFWGLSPRELRESIQAAGSDPSQIRDITAVNGKFSSTDENFYLFDELRAQVNLFSDALPNISIPLLLNRFDFHDLPRVVIPYEVQESLRQRSQKASSKSPSSSQGRDFEWLVRGGQDDLTVSCPPAARKQWLEKIVPDKFQDTGLSFLNDVPSSKDICSNPHLKNQHAAWSAHAQSMTHNPVPIFSTSKLSTHQDIIFPSPYYWRDHRRHSPSPNTPWHSKQNTLYWAGSTTGLELTGDIDWRNTPSQRHRFVEFTNNLLPDAHHNVTLLRKSASDHHPTTTAWSPYSTPLSSQTHLFSTTFSNFIQCSPPSCAAQAAHFGPSPAKADHTAHFNYRFLADIDGNAFSGRFYRYLEANATVLKQTLFQEWHDDFLIPWLHYVPLSMGMGELAEVMRWFSTGEGEARAWDIAREGGEWARRVLRREDVAAGMMRAVLEYARLVDEGREEEKER